MRSGVPAAMVPLLTQWVNQPSYLVFMGFDPPQFHATHNTTVFEGTSWAAGNGTIVEYVDSVQAQMLLRNTDNEASDLVLSTSLSDIECRVYLAYQSEAIQLFVGYLDVAEYDEQAAFIRLSAASYANTKHAPNQHILYPTFKYLVPSGVRLKWNNTIIELESG